LKNSLSEGTWKYTFTWGLSAVVSSPLRLLNPTANKAGINKIRNGDTGLDAFFILLYLMSQIRLKFLKAKNQID
jgi:hypothetical protein